MIARLACGSLHGVDALRVDLEVDFSRHGMPAFTMVGLAEGAVRESKERVFTALRASGFKLPPARVTVNLAPADRRKAGPQPGASHRRCRLCDGLPGQG